jgi:putative ABC transport system permease protein
VLTLVLVESILLIVLGGVIGLGIAAIIIPVVSAMSGGMLNLPGIPRETWLVGLALMLGIGIVVGALPAMRAMRLKIVDALAGR